MGFLRNFFGKKTTLRPDAIIDIRSHATVGLLFMRAGTGAVRVLKKTSVRNPRGADRLRLASGLNAVLLGLAQGPHAAPRNVRVIAGPHFADYAMAEWRAAVPKKNEKTPARYAALFSLIARNHAAADTVMWAYPLQIFADGYPVAASGNPEQEKAVVFLDSPHPHPDHEISFRVLTLSIPDAMKKSIEDARMGWDGVKMDFLPSAIAYHRALASLSPDKTMLLADIGGEESMLIRYCGRVLQSVRTFSSGMHGIIRAVASERAVPFPEAHDLVGQYARGITRSADTRKLREIIAPGVAEWKSMLIGALGEDYKEGPLSGDVLLAGPGAAVPDFAAALTADDWIKQFSHAPAASVRTLTAHNFFDGSTLGGYLDGPEDTVLAAALRGSINEW